MFKKKVENILFMCIVLPLFCTGCDKKEQCCGWKVRHKNTLNGHLKLKHNKQMANIPPYGFVEDDKHIVYSEHHDHCNSDIFKALALEVPDTLTSFHYKGKSIDENLKAFVIRSCLDKPCPHMSEGHYYRIKKGYISGKKVSNFNWQIDFKIHFGGNTVRKKYSMVQGAHYKCVNHR